VLDELNPDPGTWHAGLQFPRTLLVVNSDSRTTFKYRRGHLETSVPPPGDFIRLEGAHGVRECLDFSVWHGKGVVAFEHASAVSWSWTPSPCRTLRVEGAKGGLLVELGVP
jgi:hypothetical protein